MCRELTQVNVADPTDLAIVHELQDQLKLEQKAKGSFVPTGNWDMEEVLAMRARYAEIGKAEDVTFDTMFGKKGEVPLKDHNVGTAMGWGGLTPERAVYPSIFGESTEPQVLTLRDVPAGAFWSITIYDALVSIDHHICIITGYFIFGHNIQFILTDKNVDKLVFGSSVRVKKNDITD